MVDMAFYDTIITSVLLYHRRNGAELSEVRNVRGVERAVERVQTAIGNLYITTDIVVLSE